MDRFNAVAKRIVVTARNEMFLETAIATALRAEQKRTLERCAEIADQHRGCRGDLIAKSIRTLASGSPANEPLSRELTQRPSKEK